MNRPRSALIVRSVLLVAMLAATPVPPARADDVRMRASVRLPADADTVRLHHVAELRGAEAQRYADLVLAPLPDGGAPIELPIADVRMRLEAAGAHWGRLNLSGRRTIVRPRPSVTASAPAAMAVATIDRAGPRRAERGDEEIDDHAARPLLARATVRGAIARALVEGLGVLPDDLRLGFDRADRTRLDAGDPATRVEIRALDSVRNDHVTFDVRLWSNGREQESGQVRVRPLVRTPVAVLTRDVDRGEVIDAGAFSVAEHWLGPPRVPLLCPPERVDGRVASRSLRTGTLLHVKHVRRRTVVERGDRLNVRCLVGGIVIALKAEARADGAEGDIIEMRKLGERSTFLATVTGRGEAVVDLGSSAP